ncbi:hypothetical protein WG908_16245 [Sphingobium sp. AN641]|uniref:hypothetical protein n=1 Tax=Sphingobium sp. AN641 TaxID=3133443 RepID=UPI0030BAD574
MTAGSMENAFSLVHGSPWTTNHLTFSFIDGINNAEFVYSYTNFSDGRHIFDNSMPNNTGALLNYLTDFDPAGLAQFNRNIFSYSAVEGVAAFANLTFSQDLTGSGAIKIGALNVDIAPSGSVSGWVNEIGNNSSPQDGYIWLTKRGQSGGQSPMTLPHELGHLLGLRHSSEAYGSLSVEDNGKYSIMSYEHIRTEERPAADYQLYDVAALQKMYGVNTSINVGSTVYNIFHEQQHFDSVNGRYDRTPLFINGVRQFGGSIYNSIDRSFAIWDAQGGHDEINAYTYQNSAFIDLRPGHFSSIGVNVFNNTTFTNRDDPNSTEFISVGAVSSNFTVTLGENGTLGRENVSIAFGAYIEDAIGTDFNDVIIGNMLSNIMEGKGGNDIIFSDGLSISNADTVLISIGREATGLIQESYSGLEDANYHQVAQTEDGIGAVGADAADFVSDRAHQIDSLAGGVGDDLLAGGWGDDYLLGDEDPLGSTGGNDIIIGDRGDDRLLGGGGDDLLFGQLDDDLLDGAYGKDRLYGGDGDDILLGGADDDLLQGDDGNDLLSGGDGIDLLEGNAGDDRLEAGNGNDKLDGSVAGGLFGGFGDDLLVSELNDGDDDIDGGLNGIDLPIGDGTDTVVYKYYHGNSTVSINSVPFIGSQKPSDFGLTIDGARDANNVAGSFEDTSDVLTSIERAAVEAGDGSDSLVINDDSDVSYIQYVDLGGQGAAFSAYDKLDVSALSTNVTVDLRNASDQVLYINDGAFSGSELRLRDVENVNGTEYNDVLYGTNAAQGGQLRGNGGNDQLISGAGASVLEGGDGNDLLVAGGVASHLFGGSGTDRFVVGANATIEDAEQRQGEETYYAGMRLTGGVKQWWMEGNAAYYAPFTSLSAAFPVIGSELIATAAIMVDSVTLKFVQYSLLSDGTLAMMFGWGQGGTAYLENYDIDFNSGVGSAGISVFQVEVARQKWASQQNIDKYVNLALYSGFGHGLPGYDPLVLDLNGDGFDLVAETVSSKTMSRSTRPTFRYLRTAQRRFFIAGLASTALRPRRSAAMGSTRASSPSSLPTMSAWRARVPIC